jgi:hypothetical protein
VKQEANPEEVAELTKLLMQLKKALPHHQIFWF